MSRGKEIAAIEVKSGGKKENPPGIDEFSKEFEKVKTLLAGGDGIPIEGFLLTPTGDLF